MVQVQAVSGDLYLWIPALALAFDKAIRLKAVKMLAVTTETHIEHLSAGLLDYI